MTDGTDLFDIIRTTRAMRRLKHDPVPDELIRRILEAGACAANGGANQRWRFLVIKDRGIKLDFTHFKRHKRGNLQYDGTEWRGVSVHRSWRSIVKNPPTPTTSGYAQR